MNILFIHSSADLYGSDRNLLRLLNFCKKSGHNPVVCLPSRGLLSDEIEKMGVKLYVADLGVIRRMHLNPVGILKIIYGNMAGVFSLLKIIRKEKIRIVHSNTSVVFAGAFAAKLASKPHIWHIREIRNFGRITGAIYAAVLDFFSKKIICVSNAVKENLIKYRPKISARITVVFNGGDIQPDGKVKKEKLLEKYGIPAGKIYCGFVGRINRVKGAEYFIKAASEIKCEVKNAYFLIAGDIFCNNDRILLDGLKAQIRQLVLEGDVKILGFVSDIEEVFSLMDIYLFTSVRPDSFPTTILEAMIAGKPVVANDIGGAKEIVEDGRTGFIIEPGNIRAYTDAVVKLLKDERLRGEFGKNGRERYLKEFSIERFEEKMKRIYEEIAEF